MWFFFIELLLILVWIVFLLLIIINLFFLKYIKFLIFIFEIRDEFKVKDIKILLNLFSIDNFVNYK